jgi:hypothetical protein
MGIAGAALYSLVLIAGRALAPLPSHAKHALHWVCRLVLESAAHHGANLHAAPHVSVQQSVTKR